MNNQNQNTPANNEKKVLVSLASERAEALGGVLIAFFAAMMAISDLVNSNIEEQMNLAINKNSSYFSWYQSKSVKQSLQESHLATLESFIKAGMVKPEKEVLIKEDIDKTKGDIKRYKMEKKEIMEGSAHIPQAEWVQDIDGKLGVITGVKEWEKMAAKLDEATNKFDISMLFFQISLVLGAVCIIIYDNPKLQKMFIYSMIVSGMAGIVFAIYGYMLSL
jgi:hypothetical protein